MKRFLILCVAAFALIACKNEEEPAPELALSVDKIEVGAEEYEGSFKITANADWAVESSAEWLIVTPTSGHGNETVVVYVDPNKTYDAREARISVSVSGLTPMSITVRQSEQKAVIMGATEFTAKCDGDTIEVELKANMDFTVKVNDAWVTNLGERALKEHKLAFAVAKNEDYSPRTATITFNSEKGTDVVTINQSEQRAIVVGDKVKEIGADGGELKVSIKTNVDFTTSSPDGWIHNGNSRALVDSLVCFSIDKNEGVTERTGKIVFQTELGTDTVSVIQAGNEAANIEIPDAKFKALLVASFDTNEDGGISVTEAKDITKLVLWKRLSNKYYPTGVTDFTGIEYMVNLDTLDAQSNAFTTIDLSKNINLKSLNLSNTAITELNLKGLVWLKDLDLGATNVAALDLSDNALLEVMQVSGAKLTELNLEHQTALKVLNCSYNAIGKLNVSANKALTGLYCSGNGMTELNISGLTGLLRLSCDHNALTSLDATANTGLTILNCGRNHLTDLKVAGLSHLTNLSCPLNSNLGTLSLTGLTSLNYLHCFKTAVTSLDLTPCKSLYVLHVNNAQVSSINLSANTELRGLRIDGNSITTLDISANKKLKYMYADNNSSLTKIKVWDELEVDKVENFYKGLATEWEGGKHAQVVELDKANAIDLTADGNTANCYIARVAGTYKFKATVMGNGAATDGITPATLAPVKAELLWTMGTVDEQNKLVNKTVVADTCAVDGGYIYFAVPSPVVPGNAVIAAYNAAGKVIWSWHIWVSDYDAYGSAVEVTGGFKFMDRNIGAINNGDKNAALGAEPYLAGTQGMMYQWGRKDPFTPCSYIPSANTTPVNVYMASDPTTAVMHPAPEFTADYFGTAADAEAYAVAHPETYICSSKNAATSYNWFTGSTGRTDWRAMWGNAANVAKGGVKTIYDPCPKGWRVPPTGAFSFATAIDATKTNYFGSNFFANSKEGQSLYFIVTGLRFYHSGIVQVGAYGTTVYHKSGYQLNACSTASEKMQTFFMSDKAGATQDDKYYHKDPASAAVADYYWCAQPVRCVADETVAEPEAVNLSENGTANCYIVSDAGDYKFDAKKVDGTAVTGVKADWLWATATNLLSDIKLENGVVSFSTTGARGNAVIAVLDASGKVAWSWHIWATAQPADQKWNANTWMDRNVGATSNESGYASYGMHYQWGRKDPFVGASVDGAQVATHDDALFGSKSVPTVVNTEITGKGNGWATIGGQSTEANAAKYPMCFYYYEYPATAENSADAYGGATTCPGVYSAVYNKSADWEPNAAPDRWYNTKVTASGKTNNDPCPVGYMVPSAAQAQADIYGVDGTTYFPLAQAEYKLGTGATCGRYFTYAGGKVWLPTPGFRGSGASNDAGTLRYIGNSGFYWTYTDGTLDAYTPSAASRVSIASGNVGKGSSAMWKCYGFSVRCVKIEK